MGQGAMSNELIVCQAPSRKSLGGCMCYRLHLAFIRLQNWEPPLLRICSLYKPVIHLPHENCKLSKYLFYELSRLKHYRGEHPRNIWGRGLRLMHCRSTAKPAKLNGKLGWPPDWTRHSIPKAKEDPQLSLMLLRDQGHWTSDLWIWQRGAKEGTSQHIVG